MNVAPAVALARPLEISAYPVGGVADLVGRVADTLEGIGYLLHLLQCQFHALSLTVQRSAGLFSTRAGLPDRFDRGVLALLARDL